MLSSSANERVEPIVFSRKECGKLRCRSGIRDFYLIEHFERADGALGKQMAV